MKLKTKIMALNLSVLILVGTMLFLQFRAAQNKQKFEMDVFEMTENLLQQTKEAAESKLLCKKNVTEPCLN